MIIDTRANCIAKKRAPKSWKKVLKLSSKDKAPKTWKFCLLPLYAEGARVNHCVKIAHKLRDFTILLCVRDSWTARCCRTRRFNRPPCTWFACSLNFVEVLQFELVFSFVYLREFGGGSLLCEDHVQGRQQPEQVVSDIRTSSMKMQKKMISQSCVSSDECNQLCTAQKCQARGVGMEPADLSRSSSEHCSFEKALSKTGLSPSSGVKAPSLGVVVRGVALGILCTDFTTVVLN